MPTIVFVRFCVEYKNKYDINLYEEILIRSQLFIASSVNLFQFFFLILKKLNTFYFAWKIVKKSGVLHQNSNTKSPEQSAVQMFLSAA